MVNEEIDDSASKYQERLDTVISEINNVNGRLERLYDALETGELQLADLSTTHPATEAASGKTTDNQAGIGELTVWQKSGTGRPGNCYPICGRPALSSHGKYAC